jgi:hypothetical protein
MSLNEVTLISISTQLEANRYTIDLCANANYMMVVNSSSSKVETPIHDNIRESVTWECKEHGVKS